MRLALGFIIFLAITCTSCQKEEPMEVEVVTPEKSNPIASILKIEFDNSTCSWTASAKLEGYIDSELPTEYGFVYSKSTSTPTLDNIVVKIDQSFKSNEIFTASLGDLELGTVTYFRVYAISPIGIYYSPEAESYKGELNFSSLQTWIPKFELCGTTEATLIADFDLCIPAGYEYSIIYTEQDGLIGYDQLRVVKGFTDGSSSVSFSSNILEESEGRNAYRVFVREAGSDSGNSTNVHYLPEVGPSPVVSKLADFPGPLRGESTTFSFNGKGYVCGGYTVNKTTELWDLWEYTPESDMWVQKADYPGTRSSLMTSFVTDNYAYVGTGGGDQNSTVEGSSEFYRYDFTKDLWERIADFPVSGLSGISFAIEGVGYTGGMLIGNRSFSNKFYKYNEDQDQWEAIADFPREFQNARNTAISSGGLGYVLISDPGTTKYTSYDPVMGDWSMVEMETKFDGNDGLVFEKDGKVYQMTGRNASVILELNLGSEEFKPICMDIGLQRAEAGGFKIGNSFYIATGVGPNINTDLATDLVPTVYKVEID